VEYQMEMILSSRHTLNRHHQYFNHKIQLQHQMRLHSAT